MPRKAECLSQRALDRAFDAIERAGVAGLTTIEAAEALELSRRTALFHMQVLQQQKRVELGERVGVGSDGSPRWVAYGLWEEHRAYRKGLQADAHAQQKAARLERAAGAPEMTYAEQQAKLMESAGTFAEVWLAEDPEHRIVPAGQWRAEPVRVPVSVFQLGSV